MKSLPLTILLAGLALGTVAFAGNDDKKLVIPSTPHGDFWQFKLSLPGWIPWVDGHSSLHGFTSNIDLGPNNIIPKLDMTADIRAEAHRGRFSMMGEYLYMSLSDGKATDTIVKKVDVRFDQTMVDLGMAWRLLESKRGYLDVIGGARYMSYYQKTTRQANDERITDNLDELAAATGSRLRRLVQRALAPLADRNPTLPIAPLGADEIARTARAIARIRGTGDERRARIARRLEDTINRTVSRADDWVDPYVGLHGRYNLNTAFYLTAKGDIGGFSVGSDVTWTTEAAIGWQISSHIFAEVAYRALGVDFSKNGLVIDTVTHGPQISLGTNF
ncbi:MAG: hypothetical protein V4710_21740 [Verrucomicrobiota bacterium]